MAKILVVEDNEINRDMMVRRLQRRGYTIITAVDGQQGIDMTQSESPDIVLMDMSLPVVDGWEATRQIKSNPDVRHIPVVGLTAHAMVGDRDKALNAGCDDYATKPVEYEKLIELINRLIAA
jgi:two-component system, cell cycle response regulator DivK